MTKVLVTGGAGFIGSHVSEQLLLQGYDVVVLDDLSGGFVDNLVEGVQFIQGSITDQHLIQELFRKEKIRLYLSSGSLCR